MPITPPVCAAVAPGTPNNPPNAWRADPERLKQLTVEERSNPSERYRPGHVNHSNPGPRIPPSPPGLDCNCLRHAPPCAEALLFET